MDSQIVEFHQQRAVRVINDPVDVYRAMIQGREVRAIIGLDIDAQTIQGQSIASIYDRNKVTYNEARRKLGMPPLAVDPEVFAP